MWTGIFFVTMISLSKSSAVSGYREERYHEYEPVYAPSGRSRYYENWTSESLPASATHIAIPDSPTHFPTPEIPTEIIGHRCIRTKTLPKQQYIKRFEQLPHLESYCKESYAPIFEEMGNKPKSLNAEYQPFIQFRNRYKLPNRRYSESKAFIPPALLHSDGCF